MAIKDIKARLQNRVQAADPQAKVHTYMRNLTGEIDQNLLVGTDGKLHVWFIRRESSILADLVINEGFVEQKDTFLMEGFYAVNDAADSEEAFEALVDVVLQTVDADRRAGAGTKLNGTVQTAGAPALRKMDFAMFGQTQALCHHAEIVITVTPRYLQ